MTLSLDATATDEEGVRRLVFLCLVPLFLAGCFVFEELDQSQKILDQHSPSSKPGTTASSPSARRAQADPSLMDRARDVGEKIGDWWDELLKPPPGPGDEIVRCRVAGNTQFTRRDECTARGGRVS